MSLHVQFVTNGEPKETLLGMSSMDGTDFAHIQTRAELALLLHRVQI